MTRYKLATREDEARCRGNEKNPDGGSDGGIDGDGGKGRKALCSRGTWAKIRVVFTRVKNISRAPKFQHVRSTDVYSSLRKKVYGIGATRLQLCPYEICKCLRAG